MALRPIALHLIEERGPSHATEALIDFTYALERQ
jgi:hypothetical protein